MRVFAIFGDIEIIDARGKVALVSNTHSCAFTDEETIKDYAKQQGVDFILPHYFDGQIIFAKYHKETT